MIKVRGYFGRRKTMWTHGRFTRSRQFWQSLNREIRQDRRFYYRLEDPFNRPYDIAGDLYRLEDYQ